MRAVEPPIDLAAVRGRAAVEFVGHFAIDIAHVGRAGCAQAMNVKDTIGAE
jgi:hypothetical protein